MHKYFKSFLKASSSTNFWASSVWARLSVCEILFRNFFAHSETLRNWQTFDPASLSLMNSCGAKSIVTLPQFLPQVMEARKTTPSLKSVIVVGEATEGCHTFFEMVKVNPAGVNFLRGKDIDTLNRTAILPWSSGTTGPPKGVMLTHSSITTNLLQYTQPGELCVKGPQLMKGYYKNEKATKEFTRGTLVNMTKADISTSSNVAVIGVPDERAGELPRAYLVSKSDSPSEESIHQFIEAKVSPHKKLKGGVQFVKIIPQIC